jgi:hypothetical protein
MSSRAPERGQGWPAALCLLALALLPALALASAPPDTLPESFPAVMWRAVDSATQASLRDGDKWPLAAVHPEVERLLPRVSFYLRRWAMRASTAPAQNRAFAVLNGKKYGLQSLNSLLVDAGFKFDTTEIPAVAKIAVLWTLMDLQAQMHVKGIHYPRGQQPPDSAALATAIPAVTFRKIGPSKVQLDGLPARTIEVQCEVDGEPVSFHLSLDCGRYPMRLHGFGRQLMFFADPPAPQK